MYVKSGDRSWKDFRDIVGQNYRFSDYSHDRYTDIQIDGIYDVNVASRPDQTIRDRKLSNGALDLESIGACHKILEK